MGPQGDTHVSWLLMPVMRFMELHGSALLPWSVPTRSPKTTRVEAASHGVRMSDVSFVLTMKMDCLSVLSSA